MNNKGPIPVEILDVLKKEIRDRIGLDHEFVIVIFPARREDGVTNTMTTVENDESAYVLNFAATQLTNPSRPTFNPPNFN